MMVTITLRTKDHWERRLQVDLTFLSSHDDIKMPWRCASHAAWESAADRVIKRFRQAFHDATLYEEI